TTDKIGSERRQSIVGQLRPAVLDGHVSALDIAGFVEPLLKGCHNAGGFLWRPRAQPSDDRHRRLLVVHPQLSRRGPTEHRDELAPFHSITSSASASTLGGTWSPRFLAVLRLITNSNFVGWRTGRSAALAPLRICPV